jgi:purine-nucleoside phosphorylase
MDVVGMSTVPEAIVARYLGLQVCGISVVTNKASGLGLGELDHSEVVETGKKAEHRLQRLLTELTSTIIQG